MTGNLAIFETPGGGTSSPGVSPSPPRNGWTSRHPRLWVLMLFAGLNAVLIPMGLYLTAPMVEVFEAFFAALSGRPFPVAIVPGPSLLEVLLGLGTMWLIMALFMSGGRTANDR